MENGTDKAIAPEVDNVESNRPDVSGELEQPKLAGADNVKPYGRHTHGPGNFGRIIAGCPQCEVNAANPHRIKKAKRRSPTPRVEAAVETAKVFTPEQETPAPPQSVTITFEQLQALMAGQSEIQIEGLKQFATELRKPDPEEQAKRDAEKERLAQRKAIRIAEVKLEEDMKRQRWEMCAHTKENGKSAVNEGQVFSDGFFHPMCCRCGKEFDTRRPAAGSFTGAAASA